jgi:DNA invertase Pin-like site-specific DNA recombinase
VIVTRDQVKRVIGYIRVSTAEQADSGAGLEAQRQAIQVAAELRGWELVNIFEDAVSGKSLNGRHELKKALADLKARRADGLVVAKLDRLSRSIHDFSGLLGVALRQNWALVALDFDLDTSTPAGELVANVMASVAQWERRIIGQRTREGLAVKKAQGVKLGRPRSIDPAIASRIVRLRRQGLSFEKIGSKVGLGWTTVRRVVERHPA